jgi:hypothetical protein
MSVKDKYQVKSIDNYITHDWLLHKHYAKRIPSISYAFGLFYNNILVGCLTIGKPASYTLCEGILGKEHKHIVYELNRLVVEENLDKNALSYFVSNVLKILPKPMCIVSYADKNQNHYGYIYQATNWIYTGLSSIEKIYYLQNGEIVKTRRHIDKKGIVIKTEKQLPKFRYVYIIANKKEKKIYLLNLKYKIHSYPKGENKRYDASYNPTIQTQLF